MPFSPITISRPRGGKMKQRAMTPTMQHAIRPTDTQEANHGSKDFFITVFLVLFWLAFCAGLYVVLFGRPI